MKIYIFYVVTSIKNISFHFNIYLAQFYTFYTTKIILILNQKEFFFKLCIFHCKKIFFLPEKEFLLDSVQKNYFLIS